MINHDHTEHVFHTGKRRAIQGGRRRHDVELDFAKSKDIELEVEIML
jgi:hypothetical protein